MNHVCKSCGANLAGRWERLTPGLCWSLVKLWERVIKSDRNSVHLQKDLELNNNEYNNFQKLRYFGLIAKKRDEPGHWVITRRGAQFMHGKTKVNQRVRIFRNHIVEREEQMVDIFEILKCEQVWPSHRDFSQPEAVDTVVQSGLF